MTGDDVSDSAVFFDVGGTFFVEYSADLARRACLSVVFLGEGTKF